MLLRRELIEKKRELKQNKPQPTIQKNFELNIIELEKILEVLTNSKNEIQARLYNENNKLSNQKKTNSKY